MAIIAPIIRNMQTKFKIDCPGDNLEDYHLARIMKVLSLNTFLIIERN